MFNCEICNKEFSTKRQLIGHKHVHSTKEKIPTKRKNKKISGSCLNCNSTYEYWPSKYNGKYCSMKCSFEHRWILVKDQIAQGTEFGPKSMKRYICEEVGNHCSECKCPPEWNGKQLVLQLDHIDGNSDNNKLNNLRLLCPNCHSQTETFVSRNIKNSERSKYARQWRDSIKEKLSTVTIQ